MAGGSEDIDLNVYKPDENSGVFMQGLFIVLLRVGLILIQLASIPLENIYCLILQNLIDMAVATLGFGLIGIWFAASVNAGIIGFGLNNWQGVDVDLIMRGLAVAVVGSGLILTMVAGRISLCFLVPFTFLYSSIIQGILIYTLWNVHGLLFQSKFMGYDVAVKDYAGAYLIHIAASVAGFIISLFVGRRMTHVKCMHKLSLGCDSISNVLIGYGLLAAGIMALSAPSHLFLRTHENLNYVTLVTINNFMAFGTALLVTTILHRRFSKPLTKYWKMMRYLQGGIAGLVIVSAAVDAYDPFRAAFLGLLGGAIFSIFAIFFHKFDIIDDFANIFVVHFFPALFGILLAPFLGMRENLGILIIPIMAVLAHFLFQIIGLLFVILVVGLFALIISFIAKSFKCVRNRRQTLDVMRREMVARALCIKPGAKRIFPLRCKCRNYPEPARCGPEPFKYIEIDDCLACAQKPPCPPKKPKCPKPVCCKKPKKPVCKKPVCCKKPDCCNEEECFRVLKSTDLIINVNNLTDGSLENGIVQLKND